MLFSSKVLCISSCALEVDSLLSSFCSTKVGAPIEDISCIFCFVISSSELTDCDSDLSSDKDVFVSSNACCAVSCASTRAFLASLLVLLI